MDAQGSTLASCSEVGMTTLLLSSLTAIVGVIALTPSKLRPAGAEPRSLHGLGKLVRGWRSDDLPWLTSGLVIALVLSLQNPRLLPVLIPITTAASLLLHSRRRQRQARARAEAVAAELPMIIELLALSISAGEAPASSLARVATASRGVIGQALQTAVLDLTQGATLVVALERVKQEVRDPRVDRCIDAVILGYERGTSLNDVLHAQALDAREQYRRSLIEESAKAEIAMMIPVVFLIMPVTILFALFPSLHALTT